MFSINNNTQFNITSTLLNASIPTLSDQEHPSIQIPNQPNWNDHLFQQSMMLLMEQDAYDFNPSCSSSISTETYSSVENDVLSLCLHENVYVQQTETSLNHQFENIYTQNALYPLEHSIYAAPIKEYIDFFWENERPCNSNFNNPTLPYLCNLLQNSYPLDQIILMLIAHLEHNASPTTTTAELQDNSSFLEKDDPTKQTSQPNDDEISIPNQLNTLNTYTDNTEDNSKFDEIFLFEKINNNFKKFIKNPPIENFFDIFCTEIINSDYSKYREKIAISKPKYPTYFTDFIVEMYEKIVEINRTNSGNILWKHIKKYTFANAIKINEVTLSNWVRNKKNFISPRKFYMLKTFEIEIKNIIRQAETKKIFMQKFLSFLEKSSYKELQEKYLSKLEWSAYPGAFKEFFNNICYALDKRNEGIKKTGIGEPIFKNTLAFLLETPPNSIRSFLKEGFKPYSVHQKAPRTASHTKPVLESMSLPSMLANRANVLNRYNFA